ncbi:Gfo/Idh/MocA family protein [Sphingomonas paeninsulae]|uniref:Gfo/Idh/MocA family protein n=1 Tax=Sphingomonas paeninsulae TaxID=2319844 RepID=UPI001EEFAFFC|nr:Gfo/Idh/MocA family oxidoreductase [Sphingomonas paeninsulae]
MTLRVGIISANWGAYAHLPAWRATPGFEVTAICTSRRETAEAAAATHGIARPFWNAGEMIADPDIDVIDCGTRPNIRHAMVLAALRHGKHVYNGIPFAADIDRAREIHDAWLGSKSIAVVDAFAQWIPAHRLAKKMIDEGYLGQPFGAPVASTYRCSTNPTLTSRSIGSGKQGLAYPRCAIWAAIRFTCLCICSVK